MVKIFLVLLPRKKQVFLVAKKCENTEKRVCAKEEKCTVTLSVLT